MITIEASVTSGYFVIDGKEYPNNSMSLRYEADITNLAEENISLIYDANKTIVVNSRRFDEFTGVNTKAEFLALIDSLNVLGSNDNGSGSDGESAYEVAVSNGFVGNESDWLDSLVGADGAQGVQGEPGADGVGNTNTIFKTISTTNYQLIDSDNGKTLLFTNVSGCDVSDLSLVGVDGWNVRLFQASLGEVRIIFETYKNLSNPVYYKTIGDGDQIVIEYSDTDSKYITTGGLAYVYSAGGTISQGVASSADDATEIISTGVVDITVATHETLDDELYALRIVPSTPIPAGATITDASIQFTGRFTSSGTPADAVLRGQKGSNPAQFVAGTNSNISGRTQTTAEVDWDTIPAWSSDKKDADTTTPDLSAIVQEIVDDGGYTAGDAIVLILDGTGNSNRRRFDTYDFGSGVPEITITWT